MHVPTTVSDVVGRNTTKQARRTGWLMHMGCHGAHDVDHAANCGLKRVFVTRSKLSVQRSATPAGTTRWLMLATGWSRSMKRHVQSSDITWIRRAGTVEEIGLAKSSSSAPIRATPPRSSMTISGIDQTTSSMLPENARFGRCRAFLCETRNHHASTRVAPMEGITIASMMTRESIRIIRPG